MDKRYFFLKVNATAPTLFGDRIFIVGNIEELGNWNPMLGKELLTDENRYPSWGGKLSIPLIYKEIQYKYVRLSTQGRIEWERTPNKVILVESLKENESYEIFDHFNFPNTNYRNPILVNSSILQRKESQSSNEQLTYEMEGEPGIIQGIVSMIEDLKRQKEINYEELENAVYSVSFDVKSMKESTVGNEIKDSFKLAIINLFKLALLVPCNYISTVHLADGTPFMKVNYIFRSKQRFSCTKGCFLEDTVLKSLKFIFRTKYNDFLVDEGLSIIKIKYNYGLRRSHRKLLQEALQKNQNIETLGEAIFAIFNEKIDKVRIMTDLQSNEEDYEKCLKVDGNMNSMLPSAYSSTISLVEKGFLNEIIKMNFLVDLIQLRANYFFFSYLINEQIANVGLILNGPYLSQLQILIESMEADMKNMFPDVSFFILFSFSELQ